MEAAGGKITSVPMTLLGLDHGPHDTPREDGPNKQRNVDHVRADHANTNVSGREVKVEPACIGLWPERREATKPTVISSRVKPLEPGKHKAEGEALHQQTNLLPAKTIQDI